MRKITIAKLRAFEEMAIYRINRLTEVAPTRYTDVSWQWDTGEYLLTLFCDSESPLGYRTGSWLACRQKMRPDWLTPDGYVRPRAECVGWNTHCTYPSGKHNLHPDYDHMPGQLRALDQHLLELGI